jgi:hypothetical protein
VVLRWPPQLAGVVRGRWRTHLNAVCHGLQHTLWATMLHALGSQVGQDGGASHRASSLRAGNGVSVMCAWSCASIMCASKDWAWSKAATRMHRPPLVPPNDLGRHRVANQRHSRLGHRYALMSHLVLPAPLNLFLYSPELGCT